MYNRVALVTSLTICVIYYKFSYYIALSFLVHRITNMKFWGTSEAIISKTLQLLSDLSVGYLLQYCPLLFRGFS